jgi:uncharacterized protein (TIGR03083 family)
MLEPGEYLGYVRTAADGVLAAVARGPVDAKVPTCPEWTVRDLVEHLGRVHEWVSGIVTSGNALDEEPGGMGDGEDVAAWYGARVRLLLDALSSAGPDRPCRAHQPDNQRALYWYRRQALETATHRVDAELALGGPARFDQELAADGVGEVLDVWIPKVSQVVQPPDVCAPLLLACTDRPERWLVTPDSADTHGPTLTESQARTAAASVTGRAEDLLLVLWKRSPIDDRIALTGDTEIARRFLRSTLTP